MLRQGQIAPVKQGSMEQDHYTQLNETVYHHRLENGLRLYVLPKSFHKTYVTFATQYGSIDRRFLLPDKKKWIEVPDGIAHFLEHKMFEMPDGSDVFQQFGRQGAQANAFTTYNLTAYLFSATSEIRANLSTLLDCVQTPAWTRESVEKEKGIIGQEIRMYEDNPDWRVSHGLIAGLYQNHPVKIDIAGTTESIARITPELLHDCYSTFYHPGNMVLFVTGPVDPRMIRDLVEENQQRKNTQRRAPVSRQNPEEPVEAAKSSTVIKMDVRVPKCLIGFKEKQTGRTGPERLKHELSVGLLLELLFGRGSKNYQELVTEQLIDDSFAFDYSEEATYGHSMIGGNTPDPVRLISRLQEMTADLKKNALNEEAFNRAKKKQIGSMLRSFNSLEFIANQFIRTLFNNMELFQVIPVLESLSTNDLRDAMDHFDERCFSACTVSNENGDYEKSGEAAQTAQ